MKCLIIFFSLSTALSYAYNNSICTNGFQLVNNKCWKLFKYPDNHTVAEKRCAKYGGTLFMAKNGIDNRAVGQFVSSAGIDHIWIGLFCIGNDKSLCYWDDETGSAISYNNFANGFPNTGTGKCVYYSVSGNPSGQWLNEDCKRELSYVCELPPTHPDNCELNFNDNCYFLFDPLPFTEAQRQCEELCSSLVSIHSAEENRYITSIYPDTDYPMLLIGGIATSKDNVVWTDGSIMDYNNIEVFNYATCLFMALVKKGNPSRGAWFTAGCSDNAHFICKRPVGAPNCRGTPPPVTPAPPPITPPTCSTGVWMAPGTIASPGFPSASSSSCMYTLATFGSKRISFTFTSFFDYSGITIFDGDSTDSPPLFGNGAPTYQTTTSTGNTMLVYFQPSSSSDNWQSGFNATFYSGF